MTAERRQFIRLNRALEVTYRKNLDYMRAGTRSIDISHGGIRLPVPQKYTLGTVLALEIRDEYGRRQLSLTGEVAWIKESGEVRYPFEIGVRFMDINPEQSLKLAQLCRHNPGGVSWVG